MNSEDNKEEKESKQNDAVRERLQNASRRGLNTVTGGRWDKVRNAPIVGAAAKKAEEKVADKLGNTKLGKKMANHQRPNLGAPTKDNQAETTSPSTTSTPNNQKGDVGSQNLRTSLANKAKNLWNQRKKKKKGSEDNKGEEKKEESSETKESENKENEEQKEENVSSPGEKASIKRKIQIKVAIIAGGAFLIYFLVMTIASALTGGGVFKVAPISSIKDYDTDSFQSVTPEDSKAHEKEMNFYKKVKEAVKEYGEDVNMNYVVAILMDVFYEYNPSFQYESDQIAEELRDSGGLDYDKMTKNISKFANIIKNLNSTDYEIGGTIYNALKENSDFKSYYSEAIKNKEGKQEDILDEILNNVFRLGEEMNIEEDSDDTTITTETSVNNTVNNQPQNMSMNEYMTNSIYASTDKLSNPEVVKAYTVVYSTNLVATNKGLTVNNNNATTSNQMCSIKEGCSYNSKGTLVNGAGLQSDENSYFYNGGYYYKVPLTDEEQKSLNNSINSTFGNVLVNSDGTYPTLDVSVLDGFGDGDGDYKSIIKKAYGDDYKYKNIGENSYILDGSYGTKKVKTDVIFYDQKDYPNTFCGLSGYTIAGSGCGVTSMAIVVSTYENNKKYNPVYMNTEAQRKGMCGTTGTAQAFFGKEATAMHYKYSSGTKYNKTILNSTLKHLAEGHLVVVRMGAGHFTGGGHYMVLAGVDPETKKVYVYDPNNRSNSSYRKTGNGWYSFNDIIVKEAYNFYIIWKG